MINKKIAPQVPNNEYEYSLPPKVVYWTLYAYWRINNGRGGRVINMEGEISGINGNKQHENDLVTQNAFPQHQNSLLLVIGRNKAVIEFRDPNT